MKKFFYLIVSVSCIFTFLRIFQISHSSFKFITKSPDLTKKIQLVDNSCESEWIILNQNIYIRRNLIFYFIDKQIVEIYYERHSSYKFNFSLIITHDSTYSEIENTSVTQLTDYNEYVFEVLKFNYFSNKITNDSKIEIFIKTDNNSIKLENILIRNYTETNEKIKNSAICGKAFYFEPKFVKKFEWWIEMNRLNGFDKIIFFNNSLPGEFDFILKKYPNFVEVIQFNCIPNFLDSNNNKKPFIKSFVEIKNEYKYDPLYYHMHFEFVTQNECYMTNMNNYKYIAIFDQDESILQRKITKYKVLNNSVLETSDFYKSDECSVKSDWISYLDNLKLNVKNVKDLNYINKTVQGESYHFLMVLYLKYNLVEQLFSKIEAYLKENRYFNYKFILDDRNDRNFKGQKGVNFTIMIQSQSDFEYVKKLFDLYNKEVKQFLKRNNEYLHLYPENFSRLFFVNGDTTSWMCGKSIHSPKLSHYVSTHYPEKNNFYNMIWTPHEYGHVSHFRESLKDLHERNISIANIKFDFNYFLCYFKPIVTNLKYPLNFVN